MMPNIGSGKTVGAANAGMGEIAAIARTAPPAAMPGVRKEATPCRGRVCGWRAKHAVSLGHENASLLAWVGAGAEAAPCPRLAFMIIV
jgi:hypothetical protein